LKLLGTALVYFASSFLGAAGGGFPGADFCTAFESFEGGGGTEGGGGPGGPGRFLLVGGGGGAAILGGGGGGPVVVALPGI